MTGATNQSGRGPRPVALQHRKNLCTQEAARVARVLVHRIIDPVQSLRLGIAHQFRTGEAKQRTRKLTRPKRRYSRHRCQPGDSGATQKLQQECLGLIVLLVCGQQDIIRADMGTQCPIARGAGGRFDPLLFLRNLHALNMKDHIQLRTDRLAVGRPAIGFRLQAMMDVNRADGDILYRTQPRKRVQQYV